VQTGIEIVHAMHGSVITLHICVDLALDEGHNIAKCSNRRA